MTIQSVILVAIVVIAFLMFYMTRETIGKLGERASLVYETLQINRINLVSKKGLGFTKSPNEIQLICGPMSLLYTPTKREDEKFVETLHVLFDNGAVLTVTRIDAIVVTVGGNSKNFKNPKLGHAVSYIIGNIFLRVGVFADS